MGIDKKKRKNGKKRKRRINENTIKKDKVVKIHEGELRSIITSYLTTNQNYKKLHTILISCENKGRLNGKELDTKIGIRELKQIIEFRLEEKREVYKTLKLISEKIVKIEDKLKESRTLKNCMSAVNHRCLHAICFNSDELRKKSPNKIDILSELPSYFNSLSCHIVEIETRNSRLNYEIEQLKKGLKLQNQVKGAVNKFVSKFESDDRTNEISKIRDENKIFKEKLGSNIKLNVTLKKSIESLRHRCSELEMTNKKLEKERNDFSMKNRVNLNKLSKLKNSNLEMRRITNEIQSKDDQLTNFSSLIIKLEEKLKLTEGYVMDVKMDNRELENKLEQTKTDDDD